MAIAITFLEIKKQCGNTKDVNYKGIVADKEISKSDSFLWLSGSTQYRLIVKIGFSYYKPTTVSFEDYYSTNIGDSLFYDGQKYSVKNYKP